MNNVAAVIGFWIAYCIGVYVFVVRRSRGEAIKRTEEAKESVQQ